MNVQSWTALCGPTNPALAKTSHASRFVLQFRIPRLVGMPNDPVLTGLHHFVAVCARNLAWMRCRMQFTRASPWLLQMRNWRFYSPRKWREWRYFFLLRVFPLSTSFPSVVDFVG